MYAHVRAYAHILARAQKNLQKFYKKLHKMLDFSGGGV